MTKLQIEDIVSLSKRRGFVFQASEIYGGLSGFYDYGPLGVELVNNIKQLWWEHFVQRQDNVFGVDGATIQHPELWRASGHLSGFSDPMVEDTLNHKRYRADQLAGVDTTDLKELALLLKGKKSPDGNPLSEPRQFNLMMQTWVGSVEDEAAKVYLRPETAGAIFTNFLNVRETMRAKLPFGIAQIGKAFRNEISPRDFIFRVRELEQMELQYFIYPDDQQEAYEQWRQFAWHFLVDILGVNETSLSWHKHSQKERAHYAKAAHDIYFDFPFGAKELWGTHNRSDFDLSSHAKFSNKDLSILDESSGQKTIPYVIESSVGVGRLLLTVLSDAFSRDKVGGEERIVLKLKPSVAPYKIAVSPLLKNKPELVTFARKLYEELKQEFLMVLWDDNGNIGKRYRRQDEIGTPFCITVDFDSLKDRSVTIRDRDTTKQIRVRADNVASTLKPRLH